MQARKSLGIEAYSVDVDCLAVILQKTDEWISTFVRMWGCRVLPTIHGALTTGMSF